MKYYLVNGYRPSPHKPKMTEHGYITTNFSFSDTSTRYEIARRCKESAVDLLPLGENVFLRVPKCGRLSVFVYGAYDAFILIAARSQRKAYLLGTAFRAAATCFLGMPPFSHDDVYLFELASAPTPDLSRLDLARSLAGLRDFEGSPDIAVELGLRTGTSLDHVQIAEACRIAREANKSPVVHDALLHLEYSRDLVWGFMVGSFYQSHYSRDRQELTRYELERRYLENRFCYDSAFVSAFRGIECVLDKPHFRKGEILQLLSEADGRYGTSFTSQCHRSFHEVFSTKKKMWRYADLIGYYLTLRNAVSAHGNPSPPRIVMEDQVFEIQYFLQSMIADILIP